MKKTIALLLLLCLLIPLVCGCSANTTKEIEYIAGYYSKHNVSTFWDVTALCYAKQDLSNYNITPFLSAEFSSEDYGAISSRVIGLYMLKRNGVDVSSYNHEALANILLNLTLKDDEDGYNIPLLQRLYGIYALKLADVNYSDEKIKKFALHVLNYQLDDGGFSSFSKNTSDVDTTATIIPLLLYFESDEAFFEPIQNATNYLKNSKNKNDTYSYYGTQNSNSTACALSALVALGYTEEDEDIGDISLALSTFRLADGSYSYQAYSDSNYLSCAQALIAYSDLENHSSFWLSVLEEKI